MTNGGGAGMASFMSKKKKYKFQVNVFLEELLEVPFVSAVLFAKLRLLDGGNFQEHSRREEVRDHTVKWGQNYSFPCKMLANASTGVLERCVLRISVRKECKGGKSFTKLGFVDLNLAEYAGAGETSKKGLLEGYDARHRQDNSMIKFSIRMNMLSGDILFKVPSPSIKHKPVPADDSVVTEPRVMEEFSSGSLAGSIASGSSGFGSLPKKRTPLLSSELVIGHTLTENNVPVTVALDAFDTNQLASLEAEEITGEHGHSRNSSNTSQMSKASGYSSNHSHSRQSSSGDSGHIRELHKSKRGTTVNIPSTFPEDTTPSPIIINNNTKANSQTPDEVYGTPRGSLTPLVNENNCLNFSNLLYHTPKGGVFVNESADEFSTPLAKTCDKNDESVEQRVHDNNVLNMQRLSDIPISRKNIITTTERNSLDNYDSSDSFNEGVFRSKSDFQIPRKIPINKHDNFFQNFAQKSDSLFAFLTPLMKRRIQNSTPNRALVPSASLKISPIPKGPKQQTRTISLNSLKAASAAQEAQFLALQPIPRSLPHRKLLEGTPGGKLAPLAISPDDATVTMSSDFTQNLTLRRPSVTQNPSSGSLVLSETGSLDRAKAALERRKKNQPQEQDPSAVPGRVEGTRVNPDHLIDEIIKNTNLDQSDDLAESSGLQLFIAKDGTAALGSHEVKSQMSTGVFKQVVMQDKR